MSSSKLIRKEQLTAFERWELPNMDEADPEPRVEDVEEEAGFEPITAEQIEAIQQEAYREGFEQGHGEGFKAGEAEVRAGVQRLAQIAQGLAAPLEALDHELEQQLVELVVAAARQVVRRELDTAPEAILATVREAVSLLPASAGTIKLYLHPDDARLVRDQLVEAPVDDERPWKVVDDAALVRGGCRVESDRSRIDADVEKRLNTVIAQMLGTERPIRPEPSDGNI